MPAQALKQEPSFAATEPVFVFGTDLAGEHRNENAHFAVEHHGAAKGKGSGESGNAYAIPYRNSNGVVLEPGVIRNYIESFFSHAEAQPQSRFQIARLGCDAKAHDDQTMAKLFADHPKNCELPGCWNAVLKPDQPARVMLFDPGAHLMNEQWQRYLKKFFSLNAPLWGSENVELISAGHARMVIANDVGAKTLGLKHRIFGPNENYYGRAATHAAETRALWYSTHLICIMDFEQTAQPQQIRIMSAATRSGLQIEQVDSGLNEA